MHICQVFSAVKKLYLLRFLDPHFAFLQVESHAAGVAAAKAAAADKAAVASENGAGAGPIDEAVVEENDEYEVIALRHRARMQPEQRDSLQIVLPSCHS